MATTGNALANIQPVNLNPQAEDCYFYFYSKCTRVSTHPVCYTLRHRYWSLLCSKVNIFFKGYVSCGLSDVYVYIVWKGILTWSIVTAHGTDTYSHLRPSSHMHRTPSLTHTSDRETSASFATARLPSALRVCVSCGMKEAALVRSAHSDTVFRRCVCVHSVLDV